MGFARVDSSGVLLGTPNTDCLASNGCVSITPPDEFVKSRPLTFYEFITFTLYFIQNLLKRPLYKLQKNGVKNAREN
jgi:hypothetical protein